MDKRLNQKECKVPSKITSKMFEINFKYVLIMQSDNWLDQDWAPNALQGVRHVILRKPSWEN